MGRAMTLAGMPRADAIDALDPGRVFSLRDKVAVVTGAVGGIGEWLAAGVAKAGASVVVTDREEEATKDGAAALVDAGLSAVAVTVDLEDDDAADRIVKAAIDQFGRLDVLINNAGVNRRVPMLEVTADVLAEIWKIDYVRCYELSQAAARVMIEQRSGSIIQISSLMNMFGLEDVSLLGPAKAALSQLAKSMTVEFAHLGVRTNAIAPGFMDTPMNATHWTDATRAPWIIDRTPMCRPGLPSELVGVCLLLASDAGSFISGQTIYVDGGFTAGSRWNVAPYAGLNAFRARQGVA